MDDDNHGMLVGKVDDATQLIRIYRWMESVHVWDPGLSTTLPCLTLEWISRELGSLSSANMFFFTDRPTHDGIFLGENLIAICACARSRDWLPAMRSELWWWYNIIQKMIDSLIIYYSIQKCRKWKSDFSKLRENFWIKFEIKNELSLKTSNLEGILITFPELGEKSIWSRTEVSTQGVATQHRLRCIFSSFWARINSKIFSFKSNDRGLSMPRRCFSESVLLNSVRSHVESQI